MAGYRCLAKTTQTTYMASAARRLLPTPRQVVSRLRRWNWFATPCGGYISGTNHLLDSDAAAQRGRLFYWDGITLWNDQITVEILVRNGVVFFKSKLTTYSVFLIAFLMYSSHVAAQMTGAPRTKFINDLYNGCYKGQTEASQNTNIPSSLIKKYCSCIGTYVADSTNNQQVQDVASGHLPLSRLLPARQMAEKYCAKQVLGNNYRNPNQ